MGSSLAVERMSLDASGRPQPTGEIEHLEADAVILALGQVTDSAFLQNVPGVEEQRDGSVVVDAAMAPSRADGAG